jgi:peptidoglycan/LPS O-acetylase OafA/YrhL
VVAVVGTRSRAPEHRPPSGRVVRNPWRHTRREALAESWTMVQSTDLGAAPRTRREAPEREVAVLSPPGGLSLRAQTPAAVRSVLPPSRRELRRAEHANQARPRVAFRPDVEGLRAVAVVLVVAFHAGLGLPGGFLGVDVFFVISGFLITSLLVDEVRATGTICLVDFYARRARRILPAACLVLVVTAVAAAVALPALDRPALADDLRSAAFFVANWHFAGVSTDYFATADNSPVLHYWSLSVEEQFYLLWPALVLLVAGRRAARRARRRAPRDTDRRLWTMLAPVALVSLALSAATTAPGGPWAYFGTHTRAWELAIGAAVALARPHLHRLTETQAIVAGWTGLGTVLVASRALGDGTLVPGVLLIVPVAGAAAIVAAGARTQQGAAALLGRAPLATLGRLSYSWYLWHWPCLQLARRVWGAPAEDDLPPPDVALWLRLAAVLVALGLAALTFRYVEEPVRNARALRPALRRSLPAGAALIAATVMVAVVALPDPRAGSTLPATVAAAATPAPVPTPSASTRPARTPPVDRSSRLPAPLLRLAMTPAAARSDQGPSRDCFAGFGPRSAPPDCRFGDPAGAGVVVLFGDSHAAAWLPALDVAARRHHWQLWFWAKSGCGYADVREFLATYHREYTECSDWRRSALARVAALPRVDLVVVGRSLSYLGELLDAGGTQLDRAAAAPVWAVGADRTLAALAAGGRKVALLRDVPRPGFDVPACLSEHLDDPAACAFRRARHVHADAQVWAAESAALAARHVDLVDLTSTICPGEPCQVVSPGGAILYRDEHHLTATFSREVGGPVGKALARYLRAP